MKKKIEKSFKAGEPVGVDALKILLKESIEFAQVCFEVFDDGKLTLTEGIKLFWEAKDITIVIDNWDAIKREYADLDSHELEVLKQYVAIEFDIDNDTAELRIEKSFALITAFQDLIIAFK